MIVNNIYAYCYSASYDIIVIYCDTLLTICDTGGGGKLNAPPPLKRQVCAIVLTESFW